MNKYELMFIVKTTNEGDLYNEIVSNYKSIITNGKGTILNTKDMGKRKLAYPIKKEISGLYYVIDFESNIETINELNRRLKLDENIIRHLIIKLEEE